MLQKKSILKYFMVTVLELILVFSIPVYAENMIAFSVPVGDETAAEAHKLAEEVLKKIGGEKNWKKTRYIRFDHVLIKDGVEISRFQHLWDKTTGNYRMEWIESADASIISLFNLQNKVGTVYINGKMVDFNDSSPYLDIVYQKFLEHSYCLYLPFKLLSTEYSLALGTPSDDAVIKDYHVLRLRIDQKGLIPDGDYNFIINKKSKLIDQCLFTLKDGCEGVYLWKNWEKYGKLMLSN